MKTPIEKEFTILIESIRRKDDEQFQETLYDLQNLYNQKPEAEIYTDMIRAQAVLFGGHPDEIRRGMDHFMPDDSPSDKAFYMAREMRKSLTSHVCKDETLSDIYNVLGFYEEDVERTWECLFAAATYHKDNTPMPVADIGNNLYGEFNKEGNKKAEMPTDDGDLLARFMPAPGAKPN